MSAAPATRAAAGAAAVSVTKAKPRVASIAKMRPTILFGLSPSAAAGGGIAAEGWRGLTPGFGVGGATVAQPGAKKITASSVSSLAVRGMARRDGRRGFGFGQNLGLGNPRPPGRLPRFTGLAEPIPGAAGAPPGREVAAIFIRFWALSICSASKKPWSWRIRVG